MGIANSGAGGGDLEDVDSVDPYAHVAVRGLFGIEPALDEGRLDICPAFPSEVAPGQHPHARRQLHLSPPREPGDHDHPYPASAGQTCPGQLERAGNRHAVANGVDHHVVARPAHASAGAAQGAAHPGRSGRQSAGPTGSLEGGSRAAGAVRSVRSLQCDGRTVLRHQFHVRLCRRPVAAIELVGKPQFEHVAFAENG